MITAAEQDKEEAFAVERWFCWQLLAAAGVRSAVGS